MNTIFLYTSSLCSQFIFHLSYVSSVQSLSHVGLFVTPWSCQASGFPVHHQLLELAQTHILIYMCVCVCVSIHICVCVYTFPLPTKVCLVKVMVFPVALYGCGSWTVKKPEHRRIDSFELWCWRRLLRVPWTARRSNQSILNEISPGCSLERLMLKLKLQYFGHLMQSVDSLEKTLMLGGIGDRRRRVRQRIRWLDDITDSMDMGLGGLRELVMDREPWWAMIHGITKSDMTDQLNWTVHC